MLRQVIGNLHPLMKLDIAGKLFQRVLHLHSRYMSNHQTQKEILESLFMTTHYGEITVLSLQKPLPCRILGREYQLREPY